MAENGIQTLKPVDRETLKSKVSRVLREAIQTGQLKPDQRLVEEEISQQLGVSRVPVREAIAKLEQDGLVVRELGRGARVANPSESDVEEIYGLRLALELYALKIAFEKIRGKNIQTFQRLVDEMSKSVEEDDFPQLMEMDLAFHETICKVAGNQKLLDTWRSQVSQLRMLLTLSGSKNYDVRNMVKGHEQILVSIRDHDLESAENMLETHICMSRDRLLQGMHERDE
jgi:DNA-binding GntR family transcriptional regulator